MTPRAGSGVECVEGSCPRAILAGGAARFSQARLRPVGARRPPFEVTGTRPAALAASTPGGVAAGPGGSAGVGSRGGSSGGGATGRGLDLFRERRLSGGVLSSATCTVHFSGRGGRGSDVGAGGCKVGRDRGPVGRSDESRLTTWRGTNCGAVTRRLVAEVVSWSGIKVTSRGAGPCGGASAPPAGCGAPTRPRGEFLQADRVRRRMLLPQSPPWAARRDLP